ncbi:MAG: hypothetical protein [Circular genetic element sp.]|nr:MAG: hypothetical protein [Circular genetic element sp.]
MPYRRKYNKRKGPIKARNLTRYRRGKKKQVRSYPKQLQNANYVPSNRLVKFTDYRSYIVIDDGGTVVPPASHPPLLQVGLNDPTKFIESTQGTWKSNSLLAKGSAVPGIQRWLSNKVPGTTSTADYLTGSCLGARLTVTAVPLPIDVDDMTNYQQVIQVSLANQTRAGHLKGRSVDLTLNCERVSQMPMVRKANCYLNSGGTPRGCTLSMNYSFKKNNAAPGKQTENLFYADTSPLEKDIASILCLPGDTTSYSNIPGIGVAIPPMRIEIRVSYIVQLSEVNTHIGQGINDGNALSNIAMAGIGEDSGMGF